MEVSGFSYVTCPNLKCGVGYYIPRYIYDQGLQRGKERTLYCPNGHDWHYTRSVADLLQDKVTSLESQVADQTARRESNWRDYLRAMALVKYWKGIAHRRKK